jgi:phage terminase Nu1 subunit (DNA packaging protein)
MKKGLNVTQLANATGKARQTIYTWIDAGMPRNPDKTFDLPAVIAWVVEREKDALLDSAAPAAGTDSPALERYRAARAEAAELELAVKKGKLFSREDATLEWGEHMAVVRAILETWKDRLPPLLEGLDRPAMQKIIDDSVQYIFVAFCRNTKNCPSAILDEFGGNMTDWLDMSEDEKRETVRKVIADMERN